MLFNNNKNNKKNHIAIFGAGKCGELLFNKLKNSKLYEVKCFIDDYAKHRKLKGLRVFNKEFFIKENKSISTIVIAIPSLDNYKKQLIVNYFIKYKYKILTTPDLWSIKSGFPISNLYTIDPYLILGRDPIIFKNDYINSFLNKNIIIFGGAGSIGREVAHQLTNLRIKSIHIVDNNEFNLKNVYEKLTIKIKEGRLKIKLYFHLGNLEDVNQFEYIFRKHKIDIAYNTAAYKHVVSEYFGPQNLMFSNLTTCINTFEICQKYNVFNYIYVSTDKAADPKNYMGLSKLICEEIINKENLSNTKMTISKIRFGNVFGSIGSAIPSFLEQIKSGGPVIIRDKNLNRYFLSLPEASQLIILASSLTITNQTYLLDMGKPIQIVSIVKTLINYFAENPKKIKIKYSKLFKSEKVKEKLIFNEKKTLTKYKKIFKIVKNKNLSNKYYNKIYSHTKTFLDNYDEQTLETYLKLLKKIGMKVDYFI